MGRFPPTCWWPYWVILAPVGHSLQAACLPLHAWAGVEARVSSPAEGTALAGGLWGQQHRGLLLVRGGSAPPVAGVLGAPILEP